MDTAKNDPEAVPLARPVSYRTGLTVEQRLERLERRWNLFMLYAVVMTGLVIALCFVLVQKMIEGKLQ